MSTPKNSIKSPAMGNAEHTKNLGGLPPTKTQKQIADENKPPAKSPRTLGGGRSVRV